MVILIEERIAIEAYCLICDACSTQEVANRLRDEEDDLEIDISIVRWRAMGLVPTMVGRM